MLTYIGLKTRLGKHSKKSDTHTRNEQDRRVMCEDKSRTGKQARRKTREKEKGKDADANLLRFLK